MKAMYEVRGEWFLGFWGFTAEFPMLDTACPQQVIRFEKELSMTLIPMEKRTHRLIPLVDVAGMYNFYRGPFYQLPDDPFR